MGQTCTCSHGWNVYELGICAPATRVIHGIFQGNSNDELGEEKFICATGFHNKVNWHRCNQRWVMAILSLIVQGINHYKYVYYGTSWHGPKYRTTISYVMTGYVKSWGPSVSQPFCLALLQHHLAKVFMHNTAACLYKHVVRDFQAYFQGFQRTASLVHLGQFKSRLQ